jgi:GT2 family glycosyltransferase
MPPERELTRIEYHQLVRRTLEVVDEVTRPGADVIVVSRGEDELLRFNGRRGRHFPAGDDGSYAGFHPQRAEDAIEHLETSRRNGAQYFVLPAPCYWWRDYYPGLFDHLGREATTVWDDDACVAYRLESHTAGVELLVPAGDKMLYAQGWVHSDETAIARLTAIAPTGERIDLTERLFRYRHPDLARLRCDATPKVIVPWSDFIVCFETGAADPSGSWAFELESGGKVEQLEASPVDGPADARSLILQALPERAAADGSLMADHVSPAIERLQERLRALAGAERAHEYGAVPKAPAVSIVVPVHSRVDLVEHQISQLVEDPEIRATELIYVLDSPQLRDWAGEAAEELFRLYRLPFRVLAMEHAGGFAAATNAGARAARGRLLLLLNSDVLPDRPGWLGRMTRFYDSRDRIGALGAKLVYEDGSLQHAGMYFGRPAGRPAPASWENLHYFKGLGRDFPPANVARPVAAVTGACLMVDRQLFLGCGGLTDAYIQGDFEDSDLCLRLIEAGRENWYLPEAELYHLEGQSYEESQRARQGLYNRWLHSRRWNEVIEAVSARYPAATQAPDLDYPRKQGGRLRFGLESGQKALSKVARTVRQLLP